MLRFRVIFPAVKRQRAVSAVRVPGGAAVPAKENDPVAEVAAFLRRQDGPELGLHLFRLLAVGKSQPPADADAVGVTDHASRHTVQVTQQQIGGFPPHAGKAQQFLHGAGDFAAAARMAREAIAAVRGKACRAGEKTFFCGCADYRMTQAANADPEAKTFPEYMGVRFGAKFAVCSRDPEEAEIAELVKRAEGAENIIFSSCNAHLFRGQLALAAALAGKGVPMTVAALRNPYDLSLMPENTALLAAFDYTRDSLAALADVFSGGDCRGAMPVAGGGEEFVCYRY